MRHVLLPAALALTLFAPPALSQTGGQPQQPQPDLSSDAQKPQQNSADEAAVKGTMEDGLKPGAPGSEQQKRASDKVEDAAVAAKQKSDSKQMSTGEHPAKPLEK